MSFTLADLRKNSGTDFSSITKALQKTEYAKDDDADFFRLPKDKAGNGSAVLRFLPKRPDDELPWVQLFSRSFKGPTGRWYIENCRTTLKGEEDPVNNSTRELWTKAKGGDKKAEEQAKAQKRKLHYIANVYVVSCPGQPDLEGKVMRFKFGKKIFEKIADKGNPTFADEKAVLVFDALNGADFKLRMKVVDDYPNYDASVFAECSPIHEDETEMLKILNSMKPLKELVDESKFKSYADLEKRFNSTMSNATASTATAEATVDRMRAEPMKAAPKVTTKAVETSTPLDDDGELDVEKYFRDLAA